MVRRSDNLSDKGSNGLFSWFTSNIKKAAKRFGVFLLNFADEEETKKPKEDKPDDVDKLPEPPKPQPTPEPVPEVPQDPGEPFEIITDDIEDIIKTVEQDVEEPFEILTDDIDTDYYDAVAEMAKNAGLDLNQEQIFELGERARQEWERYQRSPDGRYEDEYDVVANFIDQLSVNNIMRKGDAEMLSYVEQMEESMGTYTVKGPSARVDSVSLKGKNNGTNLLGL